MKRQLPLLLALLFPFFLSAQGLTCDDEFILTGTAVQMGECIQLTADANGQQGCMWFDELTDFSQPFTHTMTMSFGNNPNGADGICLVYQSNSSSTCGISGEGIGAQGINNSFIIEFDTYQNGNLGDPFNDHAAINVNGDFNTTVYGPTDLGNIEDGQDHEITFTWNPATNAFQVFYDGVLILSGIYDIINNCFGGSDMAYWGYTSSTGGESNEHVVCPGLPPEVVADAGNTIELPCLGALAMLDGSGSDSGPEFEYTWTTSNGNIVSGENTDSPTVDEAGTYTLTVYNNITFCENTDEITVTVNQLEADIATPPFIDCLNTEVNLNGFNSSSGNNITYQWTTNDGNIVNTNGTEATVDAAGTYTLTVIYDDGQGGFCSEEATIMVEEETDAPDAVALDEILTCDPPNIELNGSGSSEGDNYTYQWTTDQGNILSGSTTLFPVVDGEGFYTLEVTNNFTGCTNDVSVFVTANIDLPDAIGIADDELGCGSPSVIIDGSLSSFGDEFTYEWTTTNGNIVNGANEMSPEVDQPGQYTLVVTNTETNCTEQTTVTVTGNNNTVTATIFPTEMLTCVLDAVLLDGSPSVPNSGLTYTWSTTDGQFGGNTDEASTTATLPGEYTLTVFDPATACTDSTTITITANTTPPLAEAGTGVTFNCGETSLQLDGSGSSLTDVTYNWTTSNGNILSGNTTLTPTVNSAGIYTLEVTNTVNGCTASDQVTVVGDGDTPVVQIMLNDTLDCVTATLTLDASGSSVGMAYNQVWTTANGQFVSGTDGLQPVVNQAGTYTLTITNTANGCSSTDSVTVIGNNTPPVAEAGTAVPFGCGDSSQQLNGSGSTVSNATYNWTTTDGMILSGGTTLTPTVGTAGTYTLEVTNTLNGCTASDQVVVVGDDDTPVVQIMLNDTLDCVTNMLTLNALGSTSGTDYDQVWTTANGNFVSGTDGLQPVVDQAGTYTLTVTDTTNACTNSASVTVVQDTLIPLAAIAAPVTLNCAVTSQVLNGSGSSQGDDFNYSWSTTSGQITSATDTLLATINAPGTYQLQVVNSSNNCSNTATVTITQDITPPELMIPPVGELNCGQTDMIIMATLGTDFPNPNYQWGTTNGMISGTTTTAQITALEPGTYTVTVVNPANSCSHTESVTLTENVLPPNAVAGSDQELTCAVSTQSLGGNSSSGNNISYTWTSTNGTLTAADSLINVSVTAPGTYVLEVLNTDNFCTDMDTVIVTQDIQPPFAQIAPPQELTCTDSLSLLDGSGSGGAANLAFAWSTTNGSLVGNASAVQVNAGQAGMYQLVVTNTTNGCTDTTQTTVIQDENFPQANITMPQPLTCTRLFVNLSGTANSNSGNVNFTWSTADGNITAGANTLQPEVNSAGNYVLTVEDTDNNCTAQASIQVLLDDTPPTVTAGLDTLLNCNITQLQLAATADAQGAGLTYDWSTMNGNLTAGTTIATPDINAAGTYLVEVTNTTNGCTASDEVQVTLDTISPTIQILPPSVLTCADTLAALDASGSTAGSAPVYAWTSPDGQNIEAADTPVASVMQAGTYTVLVTNTDNGCTQQSTVTVTDDLTPPSPSLSVSDTLDCATFSVDLDATQSTGTSLSYAWSSTDNLTINNPTSATPTVQQAGNYDLLLTDGENGCTATASITVEDNSEIPLFMIQEPITIDCNNPIIQLTTMTASNIGDNPTYSWTTLGGNLVQDETTLTPTVDEAGSYILTVTNNDNGCVGTDTILVRDDLENPIIQFASVDELNCTVLTVGVNAAGSSGNGPLTFNWQSPDGNITNATDEDNITVDAPGAYGLLLLNTNNGCTDSLGITVTQDTIQPQLTIAPPAILDCDTGSFMLDANGSSTGPNLEINWTTTDGQIDGGANSLEPTISQPGVYTLEIINTANTCTNSTEVTVTQDDDVPTILFASPEELNCVLLMTDLDASASSVGSTLIYTWTTTNGNFTGGTAGLTPTVNAPGTYTLTIENPDNNCENSASVVVMQDVTPPIAQAGSDFVLDCTDEQDDLDGTASSQGGNFTYLWTAGAGSIIQEANTLTPTITAPDSYQLLVTNNDNGCTATDVITIIEDIPTAVLDAVQPLCFGDEGTITFISTQGGTPPYLYTIDDGNSLQLQPFFSNLSPDVYSALIEDSNGCTYSETIEINEPDSLYTLITNPESELEIKFGDSVRLTAQVNYPLENLTVISWQDSTTLSCGNCLAPYALPTQTSLYQLTVISENGCTDEALVRVFVNREFPVYFPNGFSPNGDGDNDVFYPFAELGAVTKIHEFQIFDRWGNLMHYTQNFSPNDPFYGWDGEQNGVPMNPAVFVYFAEVEFADGRIEVFQGDVTLVR